MERRGCGCPVDTSASAEAPTESTGETAAPYKITLSFKAPRRSERNGSAWKPTHTIIIKTRESECSPVWVFTLPKQFIFNYACVASDQEP